MRAPTIRDVARQAGVSLATVSRVLNGNPSVREEIARRVRQAAEELGYRPNPSGRNLRLGIDPSFGPSFDLRTHVNLEAKRRIAQRAAEEARPSDVVALDSGSTVAQMVPHLPQGVVAYTNSLAVLQAMARRNLEVHLAPGLYVPAMAAVFGPETEAYFAERRLTRFFLSSARLDVRNGLYNVNPFTIGVKRALLTRSEQVVLLVDHDKFCDAGLPAYAPLSAIHLLVTDYVPESFREALFAWNVPVIEVARPARTDSAPETSAGDRGGAVPGASQEEGGSAGA
ncbi:MAG: LacI family DNA-binding transcriptional regulator [Bacillota bacterium]|nr:LacI family DNA-binding transcriptional regulator [Bacillota bacterium]